METEVKQPTNENHGVMTWIRVLCGSARSDYMAELKRACWKTDCILEVTTFRDGFFSGEYGFKVRGPVSVLEQIRKWVLENQ